MMDNRNNAAKLGAAFLSLSSLTLGMAGCEAQSASAHVDPQDIKYVYDNRTDTCFAYVGTRQAGEFVSTGLSLSYVPCTDRVLREIDIER